MITKLLIAWGLMAGCVIIHAFGIAVEMRRPEVGTTRLWARARVFVRLAGWIVLLHITEMAIWAVCYVLLGAMPDVQTAMYFSAVTYTTTGYGDLVLPPEWRVLGAVEALTGILMCGWSTGFFFAMVNQMLTTALKRPGRSL
jgi:voltage-gated potassium channel Kch